MLPTHFPLRWESTGDHWWYASPIDYAAANGHYDTVRELLRIDANHLITLTSLRRIRRLETVWDDDHRFRSVAKCRSDVAKQLFLECQNGNINSLLAAGYGGWLLYSAASAGDFDFVKELLARNCSLVFGDGEYGITDILYAGSRGGNADVFWFVYNLAKSRDEVPAVYKMEVLNRAIHSAARGGNVSVLKKLVRNCRNVSAFRDRDGATVLHSAAACGRDEVVDELLSLFDVIIAKDCEGNTALHVAAYHGRLSVVEKMISACRMLVYCENHDGDNFLHKAVAGVGLKGFRRLDRQMVLIERVMNVGNVINGKNREGRTPLHMAVVWGARVEILELLMSATLIDANCCDNNGMTPIDILRRRKKMSVDKRLRRRKNQPDAFHDLVARMKTEEMKASPGVHFQIPDSEIRLYSGMDVTSESRYDSEKSDEEDEVTEQHRWRNPRNFAGNDGPRWLKMILPWSQSRYSLGNQVAPIPLRQRFSKTTPTISDQVGPVAVMSVTGSIASSSPDHSSGIHHRRSHSVC